MCIIGSWGNHLKSQICYSGGCGLGSNDKRILVIKGWKYVKYELQVTVYVAEEGRG